MNSKRERERERERERCDDIRMKRRDTQLRVTKQLTVDTENVQHSESTITNLSQLSLYISDNGAMRVDGNTIIHYGTHLKVPCVFKKILSNVCVRL